MMNITNVGRDEAATSMAKRDAVVGNTSRAADSGAATASAMQSGFENDAERFARVAGHYANLVLDAKAAL